MKFFPESATRCAARLGTLSEFERLPNTAFETPLLLVYTKRGSIPHLTKDVFKLLTKDQQLLSASLPTTITMAESIKKFKSFCNFISLPEYPVLLTIQDPSLETPSGYQSSQTVSVWSKNGRHSLTPDAYMDLVEAFKPDLYIALCDGDTDLSSKPKRIAKAVERSRILLDACTKRHEKSEILKSSAILGAVEGGYDLKARELSIKHLAEKSLAGFVLDGFHKNGPNIEKIASTQIDEIVRHSISLLPADKLRISMGSWNPATVVDLVNLGVDVFDSSYPYLVTERSEAVVFMCAVHHSTDDSPSTLILEEDRYADNFSPICELCQCLTCRNHTRAYLHHLSRTKELLGPVLLMIHNMHQYFHFFKAIRKHLKNGTFDDFRMKVRSQFSTGH